MNPPWEQFPTYERGTIGWRMGVGEQHRYDWYDFLKTVPEDFDSRIKYLRSHRPAPISWGDAVLATLYPNSETDEEFGCSPTETSKLLELGVVEHDAAYKTWLGQQTELTFPWSSALAGETPEETARYSMREFWFLSRYFNDNRSSVSIDEIPDSWASVQTELETGELGKVSPDGGLTTISQMLCAGDVRPPWKLGLTPNDYANSFEIDMGYSDAYRLWIRSSFDDDQMLREMLGRSGIPNEWASWIDEQATFR